MFLSIWLTVLCTISTLVSCNKSIKSSRDHATSWCMSSCWCYASTWKSTIIAIGFVILTIIIFVNIALQFGQMQMYEQKNNTLVTVVRCLPMPDDMVAMDVLKNLDIIFNKLLPYVLIIVIVIVNLIQLGIHYRHGMMPSDESASLSTNNIPHSSISPTLRLHVERDVTTSVIVNVILFLLCTLPSQCFYLYTMIPKIFKPDTDVTSRKDNVPEQLLNPLKEIQTLLVSQLLMFLVVLRCTLAFVVYTSVSQFFRARTMRYILPERCKRRRVSVTIIPMTEQCQHQHSEV